MFIHIGTWIAGKYLVKHHYKQRKNFNSNLTMEGITDAYYKHAEIQNLGQYCDLYVPSDTLLLADVIEGFQNKYIEIYELDPV